ncbi:hypothetical protein [Flavobacterium okayamense]|uniref:DUF4878 domain-containing protein n=1 Tax=Flavobacterium okayamense TaxID=2830782 RepID=A0ABM7S424_9FLAO|nr:hypothetical protein [Flavobacterium okayamense]BCY27710.1 hypothetical protein KK2020170_05780 [Flavobacterium okayamense]
MKKIFLLIVSTYFLISCDENKVALDLAEDIVNCPVEDLDSILEKNRPVTDFYLDSVLVNKPSQYFKSSKDFFDQKENYLTLKGGNYKKGFLEYYINYNVKEGKQIEFIFVKKNEKWILIKVFPKYNIDFIR